MKAIVAAFPASIALALLLPAVALESEARGSPGWRVQAAPVDPTLERLTDEQLIARLCNKMDRGIDAQPATQVDGFLPLNAPSNPFSSVPPPAKSPVMIEIVRRGAPIIPALLAHLSDSRVTGLVLDPSRLHLNGFSGRFTNTYDYRFHEDGPQPAGVNSKEAALARGAWPYAVRVGDLCFVALGQIVNRRLYVAGPDFGNGIIYAGVFSLDVNSPVESPSLAAAARADWGGITSADFAAWLKRDALSDRRSSAPRRTQGGGWLPGIKPLGALVRLLFYYPDIGIQAADTLLHRPLEHWALDSTKGTAAEPHASDLEQIMLVMTLVSFQWRGLDDAVWDLFQAAAREEAVVVAARPPGGLYARMTCDLPLACARRLVHRGHDDELRSSFSVMAARMNRELASPDSPPTEFERQIRRFHIESMRQPRIDLLHQLGVDDMTMPTGH